MGTKKGITLERLKLILRRQDSIRWGADYIPSILATPQEAPSLSRPSILTSGLLRREVHVLSPHERIAALLALYNPALVELHEQKMLSPGARAHPLSGFPGMTFADQPPILGTIDVADRLGYLSHLPRLKISNPEDSAHPKTVIFPYTGDLLLYLKNDKNRVYCINWNIKDKKSSFSHRLGSRSRQSSHLENSQEILARHQIEEVYYKDANIRTIYFTGDAVDRHVTANLTQLFGYHRKVLLLNDELKEDVFTKFRVALATGIPPMEVIMLLCERGRVSSFDCRTILYQAIWQRKLKVDLFRPILIDHPLVPQTRDVLDEYADWFAE